MTTNLKTLDYYLEHPHEMPTDAETIEKLFEAHQSAHPDAAGDIPYTGMERRINEAKESHEAEVVARKAADDYAKQLEENIREVNDRIKALEAGGAKPADAPVTMELPKELMDTLRLEFPTIAKAVDAQQALLKHAAAKLEAVEKRIGSAERERTKDVESEVNSLIARVPELKAWREKTPYLFARAQQVEGDLFKDKAFMDAHPELLNDDVARYKEVVKRVKQEIEAPNSLSDLPAGKPAGSPSESLENLSATEIGNRFMGMTPEKILEQLARL
jgi:chromosome segregation ATPase